MIILLPISYHRDPRRKARPNIGPPPRNIESQSANSVSNPKARGPSCSILRPMLFEHASMSEVVAQPVHDTLSAIWGW